MGHPVLRRYLWYGDLEVGVEGHVAGGAVPAAVAAVVASPTLAT